MNYISVKEAAVKWGVSARAVQTMCKNGLIHGALKWERSWMLPENAERPFDRRTGAAQTGDNLLHMPMPRKCPILFMTDLYLAPGKAKESVAALAGQPEAAALLEAWFAYGRGEIEKVYENARYFLSEHSGYYATVSAGILLSLCAMWRGDIELWYAAKKHILEAPCEDEKQREELIFWSAAADSAMFDASAFPDWFRIGRFNYLSEDSLPAARFFYVKHLFISASELALGKIKLDDVSGLGLFRTLPYIVEPMISHARLAGMVVIEIYLRLLCATAYHHIGDDKNAIMHIDAAINLALPDKLYTPLVELGRSLDNLLEERLALADMSAYMAVKALHKQMINGWIRLYNDLNNAILTGTLSKRELEIARLAAFGYANKQIADRLHLSLATVKQAIRMAVIKSGVDRRSELWRII